MESINEIGSRKVIGVDGEGVFFESLFRGKEFTAPRFDFNQFKGAFEIADVEAANR